MIQSSNVLLEQSFNEVAKKFDANTSSFKENLYPKVKASLDTPKGKKAYKECVAKFIEDRATQLYDTIPVSRIFCGETDFDNLFTALNIPKEAATDAIAKTYFGDEPHFSPKAAKHEFTVTQLCVVRYFVLEGDQKEAELAMLHLAFSGKFYPSLHYRSFPIPPARHVMEYVVNNVLSTKYDLVAEGSIIGCVRKIGNTWLRTYKNIFKTFTDENCKYLIEQLYSRIGSFMKNLASSYMKTYKDKDNLYIAYSGDSYEDGDFHLADNDTMRVGKITEKTITYINSTGVDYAVCNMCSDENITVNEIKSIMESLFSDPNNMTDIRELISLIVVTYFANGKNKDVTSVEFVSYSIAPKPNAKQKEILRQKELVEKFLCNNSMSYIRRRSRNATRNSYERAIRSYFTFAIHNANR